MLISLVDKQSTLIIQNSIKGKKYNKLLVCGKRLNQYRAEIAIYFLKANFMGSQSQRETIRWVLIRDK